LEPGEDDEEIEGLAEAAETHLCMALPVSKSGYGCPGKKDGGEHKRRSSSWLKFGRAGQGTAVWKPGRQNSNGAEQQ
jgi:hypothetical protein